MLVIFSRNEERMGAVGTGGAMDDTNCILQAVHASFESCYLFVQVLSRNECEAVRKNEDYSRYEAGISITYRLPSPGGSVPGNGQ